MLFVHLQGACDAFEIMGNEVVNVERPFHLPLNEFRDRVTGLEATERGTHPLTPNDQVERTRADFVTRRRDAWCVARAQTHTQQASIITRPRSLYLKHGTIIRRPGFLYFPPWRARKKNKSSALH